MIDVALRAQLASLLDWHEAHATFDQAVKGLSVAARGRRPKGAAHSAWEIVEHIRLAQFDILDFCRNPDYADKTWPDDYWPKTAAPPSATAWARSVAAVRRDREALKALAGDTDVDLLAPIPHGTGQTILRELLLVADHTAYHVGELVLLRRLLGVWKP